MAKCAECLHWQCDSRDLDDESPCSKLPTLGVRAFPSRFATKLITPRDFECAFFEDAERDLSTEKQLQRWFPVRTLEAWK